MEKILLKKEDCIENLGVKKQPDEIQKIIENDLLKLTTQKSSNDKFNIVKKNTNYWIQISYTRSKTRKKFNKLIEWIKSIFSYYNKGYEEIFIKLEDFKEALQEYKSKLIEDIDKITIYSGPKTNSVLMIRKNTPQTNDINEFLKKNPNNMFLVELEVNLEVCIIICKGSEVNKVEKYTKIFLLDILRVPDFLDKSNLNLSTIHETYNQYRNYLSIVEAKKIEVKKSKDFAVHDVFYLINSERHWKVNLFNIYTEYKAFFCLGCIDHEKFLKTIKLIRQEIKSKIQNNKSYEDRKHLFSELQGILNEYSFEKDEESQRNLVKKPDNYVYSSLQIIMFYQNLEHPHVCLAVTPYKNKSIQKQITQRYYPNKIKIKQNKAMHFFTKTYYSLLLLIFKLQRFLNYQDIVLVDVPRDLSIQSGGNSLTVTSNYSTLSCNFAFTHHNQIALQKASFLQSLLVFLREKNALTVVTNFMLFWGSLIWIYHQFMKSQNELEEEVNENQLIQMFRMTLECSEKYLSHNDLSVNKINFEKAFEYCTQYLDILYTDKLAKILKCISTNNINAIHTLYAHLIGCLNKLG